MKQIQENHFWFELSKPRKTQVNYENSELHLTLWLLMLRVESRVEMTDGLRNTAKTLHHQIHAYRIDLGFFLLEMFLNYVFVESILD